MRRPHPRGSAGLLLAGGLLALLPASSLPAADMLRALIVDGRNNHAWEKTTPALREILEDSARFYVHVATAPQGADFSGFRPDFASHDVVVLNYNGEPWPGPVREAFEEYVREGGGVVVVHAANNAFPGWPEYNEIIGLGGWGGRNEEHGPYLRLRDGEWVRDPSPGRGGSHGAQHAFLVKARAPEHPVLDGLPPRWRHARDELYDRLRGPARRLRVLASSYASPDQGGSGEHEPVLMEVRYGDGRVFHTTLGHGVHAMSGVGFRVTLQRGAEWAATGEVTLTDLPEDFPTEDEPSTREFWSPPDGFTPLFDGRDLDGWERKNGSAGFRVEGGMIVGRTSEGSPNSFLCTEEHYGDFELRFEVLVDDELNSGVQIRSNATPEYRDGRVHGYQVEIATNGTAGFIYDEARRGWLSEDRSDPDARAAFRRGRWNRYRVRCVGPRLRTWVNGVPVADLEDDMTAEGFIGLQVHGIREGAGPYEVCWRHLVIRELGDG